MRTKGAILLSYFDISHALNGNNGTVPEHVLTLSLRTFSSLVRSSEPPLRSSLNTRGESVLCALLLLRSSLLGTRMGSGAVRGTLLTRSAPLSDPFLFIVRISSMDTHSFRRAWARPCRPAPSRAGSSGGRGVRLYRPLTIHTQWLGF